MPWCWSWSWNKDWLDVNQYFSYASRNIMTDTEHFIYQFDGSQKDIMLFFDRLLTADFGLRGKISYTIPFYYNKSWICYLNPLKHGAIELAFTRGNELSNVQGLLQSKGRKQVSGIELADLSTIPQKAIEQIIHEAVLLDEHIPYASKRQK